ncbi:hypothetical protein [Belnapia rosea]|uniref:PilZ domain-containing protein n=1 Tax=Belnapia rosea TaxID=938405 RepID=A0A1G6RT33_9PROT|nr:hypothetical protein [Belnapia rosea]SDD07840.1 hypothetical protein SAMN04487779_1004130 [Belnapia rosea]
MKRRSKPRQGLLPPEDVLFGRMRPGGVPLNLSAPGAGIALPCGIDLPGMMAPHLPDGVIHTARCRWQRGDEAGFEFIGGTGISAGQAATATRS